MTTQILLTACTALVTLVGLLAMAGIHDIRCRIIKLEKQDARLNAAIMTLLISKADDHAAIAAAIHSLLINGINVVGERQ